MLNRNGRIAIINQSYTTAGTDIPAKLKNQLNRAGTSSVTFSTVMNLASNAKDLDDVSDVATGVTIFCSADTSSFDDDTYYASSVNLDGVVGSCVTSKCANDSSIFLTCQRAFKNNTNAPITVKELCMMIHIKSKENFLLYKEKLPQSVIVNPGQIKYFSVVIR